MEAAHIAEAHALSLAVRWPHRIEDLRFLLELGRGLVLLEGETVIGMIMWWPFGARHAALGMVIVTPERQGRGLGRQLMDLALGELGSRDVLLNASKEGVPLYAKVGFRDLEGLGQHQGVPSDRAAVAPPGGARLHAMRATDLDVVIAFDARASGLSRAAMLRALLGIGEGLVMERDGRLLGYALFRRFGHGHVIGPVAASDERIARSLIGAWIESRGDGFLRVDAPSSSGLSDWLVARGLAKVDDAYTMVRGAPPARAPEGPRLFALTSQALG